MLIGRALIASATALASASVLLILTPSTFLTEVSPEPDSPPELSLVE